MAHQHHPLPQPRQRALIHRAHHGLQIQQVLRDERSTAITAAGDIAIDDADVPF
jgi:hypothetical protein